MCQARANQLEDVMMCQSPCKGNEDLSSAVKLSYRNRFSSTEAVTETTSKIFSTMDIQQGYVEELSEHFTNGLPKLRERGLCWEGGGGMVNLHQLRDIHGSSSEKGRTGPLCEEVDVSVACLPQ